MILRLIQNEPAAVAEVVTVFLLILFCVIVVMYTKMAKMRKELEAQFQRVMVDSAVAFAEFDVTEDKFIKGSVYFKKLAAQSAALKGSQMIVEAAKHLIAPEDNAAYIEFMQPHTLQHKFHSGLTDDRMEMKGINARGKSCWIEIVVFLEKGVIDNHLICYHMIRDISSRKNYELQLKEQAEHDGLTGLYNRRTFEDKSMALLQDRRAAKNTNFAFMILDIDAFKEINDTYGHQEGDAALKLVGSVLQKSFRETDIVARMGGDEFTVLMYNVATREDVAKKARQIIEAMDQAYEAKKITCPVTVSIGVEFFAKSNNTYDQAYKKADRALYKAKAAGKRCFEFYE
jgi:diguanylate cyclase (GGDEF)-like protein